MPKILVVFYSRTADTAALAESVAEGAESVRFTEVDVRRLDDSVPGGNIGAAPTAADAAASRRRYPSLGSAEELREYDGIVLGAEVQEGAMSAELEALLSEATRLRAGGAFENKVGAAFASMRGSDRDAGWPILRAIAGLGMIIVPAEEGGATSIESARDLGRRVARVTGWVRHALGHEQEHAHGHAHSHAHGAAHQQHAHGHEHGHGHEG